MAEYDPASPGAFKAHVEIPIDLLSQYARIWIWEEGYRDKMMLHIDGKGQFVSETFDPRSAKPPEPTMIIPVEALNAVVLALNKVGIKPESDSITKGKLEASLYHLEDMRKLVFGDNKSKKG